MERKDLDYLQSRYKQELERIAEIRGQKLIIQSLVDNLTKEMNAHYETLRELVDEIEIRKAERA